MLLLDLLPTFWPNITLCPQKAFCKPGSLLFSISPSFQETNTIINIPADFSPLYPLVVVLEDFPETHHIQINCYNSTPFWLITTSQNCKASITLYAHPSSIVKHAVLEDITTHIKVEIAQYASYVGYLYAQKNLQANLTFSLRGPDSEALIQQLCFSSKNHHPNINITIEHVATNSHSKTFCRNVTDNDACITLVGKVQVSPLAHNSEALLEMKNILLSPTSHIKASPQLSIENKDVLCSHTNSIGSLDGSLFFYLQSRGLSDNVVQKLLLEAFLAPVLPKENIELSSFILKTLPLTEYA